MDMQKALVVIVVILLLGFLVYSFYSTDRTPQVVDESTTEPPASQSGGRLAEILGRDISPDAERVELEDRTNSGFSAIAVRESDEGVARLTVLADLREAEGTTYHVWVGEQKETISYGGQMVPAKGGYVFEQAKAGELSMYNFVTISQEQVLSDSPSTVLMQGSF